MRSVVFRLIDRSYLGLLLVGLPLALSACVGSKKPTGKTEKASKSVESFVVDAPPEKMKALNVNFDDRITLLGYSLETSGAVKPGQRVKYTMYWKTNKALEGSGWKLFTHIMNAKNRKVLNIDNVGALRDSGKNNKQLHPPSKWEAGKIYADSQFFIVPKNTKSSNLKIVTGIWRGKERLKINGGPNIGDNRGLVATLKVGAGKKRPNTRVPELSVPRLGPGQAITIDGKLNDSAWSTSASTGRFVNVATGDEDDSASVQGSAKLLWDDTHLYLGFEVQDQNVVGGFPADAKDPRLWTKDCVEIMIDPDGDGDNKDYYEIQVNPQNLVFDSRFDSYNQPKGGESGPFGHQNWSANLKSAVSVQGTIDKSDDKDEGYTVEIQIPWKSLAKAKKTPPEPGQEWRMNLYAMQNNGGVAWSPILKQGNFHKASRFGRVLWQGADSSTTAKSKQAGAKAAATAAKLKASGAAKPSPLKPTAKKPAEPAAKQP